MIDSTVPDHIRQLRDTLQRFVQKEMPRVEAARWDKENYFPREVFDKLATLGVMGLAIPEEYGGAGRDILAAMVTIEELAKRSLAIAVPYIMTACYAGMTLAEVASEEQKRELLPRVAEGRMIFAYGWTEPDVGADVASVKTTAVRDGNALVVNGSKRFCSGAGLCNYIYTLVRTGPASQRGENLSFVLIPPNAPGVSIEPINSMGLKGVPTTDVVFTNVRIPCENLVGGESGWNTGWAKLTGSGLNVEKLEVAALALGIGTAAFEDALEYSKTRRQFGKAIGEYQSIQHKLANMRTQLHAARLMLYHAAVLADRKASCGVETSMAKLFCSEVGKAVALEGQTILGAYGYVKELDMERYVRDALLMPIIGGSSAVQLNNIANWTGARQYGA